ncbi:MAG: type I secretion system permease/ATPase [Novosphingobium sp.]|uniref:type I secretion system permease/ATPase n=1 Tax=Novosphingobium sp. TaxID=1874826 RepID=UPI0032B960F2
MRGAFAACRSHFYAAIGFSALISLLNLAPTIYMMQVYDRVVPTGGVTTLVWITVILGIALGTLAALDNVRARLMAAASLKLNEELSGRIMAKLVSAQRSASTGQAMREFDTLRQTLTGPAVTAMFDAPWTPIYFIVAFLIHPLLGLMIVIGSAILIALAVLNERNSRAHSKVGMQASAAAYQAQEALSSQAELIGVLGLRKAMVKRQQVARTKGLHAAADAQRGGLTYSGLIKFTRMLMQSLALGLGAVLAINGMISSGTIIAASVLLSRALQPVEQLVGTWSQIQSARQALETLGQLLGAAGTEDREYHRLPEPTGHLLLAGITMHNAKQDAFILRSVSLELKPGEVVGMVGHSGAGKSTLMRIAAGALTPHVGEVRIDGANFTDWEPDALANHIGYMPQASALLPGTIAENISRFAALRGENPDEVADRVIEAGKLTGVHEMILRFPGGYDAKVGEDGFGLSGGQLQRIALARALYGAPKVVVLDEPNAALDSEGERALLWAISNAKARGAAVLVAAHQGQIINSCDRLVVLRNGAIEHQGTSAEVIGALREEAARGNVLAMQRDAGGGNV